MYDHVSHDDDDDDDGKSPEYRKNTIVLSY